MPKKMLQIPFVAIDTQQQQQHCEGIPGTRRRRKHLPPLNLCTDRKVTVTWKFHNMKKTPLHKQPSPAVCTTPDPVELTGMLRMLVVR